MKNLYQLLYGVAALLLLTVILGGSLTKPVFNNYSVRTLETAGVKRASMDSIDSRIDDMLFNVKKVQLQIEKIKNIFSSDEIDESKYQRTKSEVFVKNIYNPMNELLIVFYRIGFFFVSIILFLSAVIFQLIYRSRDLRRRVEKLETLLPKNI
ncbi:MAG TPA: hypothetical protein PK605_14510 [Ignavibacteria bacterium]|nr:hypothetical protein [Ignavibacteria bacterium]HRF67311.1 hypothetical protein [Ignavibacteria bacterium]HRJ05612.1 hypothetical protein [Ignavibacteria bacterium]HRJ86941.1 hypothetical protein [Ignavibacteria bacterium]